MFKLLKISLLLLALYFACGMLLGFGKIEPVIADFLKYVNQKIIEFTHLVREFVNNSNLNLSGILTLVLIFLLCCYIIYFVFELMRKIICRISGRLHSPLEVRTKIRKAFFSVFLAKVFIILLQLLLLVVQAWSVSKFIELFIDKPRSLLDLIKSDALFFTLLLLLLLSFLLKKSFSEKREDRYQLTELN